MSNTMPIKEDNSGLRWTKGYFNEFGQFRGWENSYRSASAVRTQAGTGEYFQPIPVWNGKPLTLHDAVHVSKVYRAEAKSLKEYIGDWEPEVAWPIQMR